MSFQRGRHRARGLLAALVLGSLTVGIGVMPVSAANNVTLNVYINGRQLDGANAGHNKQVKIVWRDAGGRLKAKQKVMSDDQGYFFSDFDFDVVGEAGDSIKTVVGGTSRTYNVPMLTMSIFRASDVVKGRAPKNSELFVEVETFNGGFADPSYNSTTVAVNANGNYNVDTSAWADIKGFDRVTVSHSNARGDTTYYGNLAESLRVWLREAEVNAFGNAGRHVHIDLLRGSKLAAETGGRLDAIGFQYFDFVKKGARVRTAAGDQVVSDHAPDGSFVMPDITVSPNKGNNKIAVNCGLGAGAGVVVELANPNFAYFGDRYGFTNASGVFTANFNKNGKINFKSGDKVTVYCKLSSGDLVGLRYVIK